MPDPTRRPIVLAPEDLALLQRGCGVAVASRDATCLPDLVRGVGQRVEPNGEITVFLSRVDGAGVLANLRENGAIAAVFSQPSTHRTVQMKATRVSIAAATAADVETVERCRAAMSAELHAIGYGPEFARALLACEPADLVAVRFAPESAFDQTPGPKAGAPIATR
ncbi:MAG: hypothetical protein IT508_11350 [Burkholderiaceae bacterium]|nr:hypothetical protein [Burkholderiaceae bacterium]